MHKKVLKIIRYTDCEGTGVLFPVKTNKETLYWCLLFTLELNISSIQTCFLMFYGWSEQQMCWVVSGKTCADKVLLCVGRGVHACGWVWTQHVGSALLEGWRQRCGPEGNTTCWWTGYPHLGSDVPRDPVSGYGLFTEDGTLGRQEKSYINPILFFLVSCAFFDTVLLLFSLTFLCIHSHHPTLAYPY